MDRSYGIREMHAFQMSPVFWDIEEYDETDDLNMYNVMVNGDGIPIYVNSLQSFIDTFNTRKGIFVLTLDGQLRMSERKIHHSDLTHGEPVLCAGEFALSEKGRIRALTNRSGHYLPSDECLDDVLHVIRMNGYNKEIRLIDEKKSVSKQRQPIISTFSFKKR